MTELYRNSAIGQALVKTLNHYLNNENSEVKLDLPSANFILVSV